MKSFVLGIISDLTPERCTVDEVSVTLNEAADRGVALAVRWVPALSAVGARLWHHNTLVVTDEDWAHGGKVLCGARLAHRLGAECAAECRAACVGETADEPQSGDWGYFIEEFGEATAAERRAFARGYTSEEQ